MLQEGIRSTGTGQHHLVLQSLDVVFSVVFQPLRGKLSGLGVTCTCRLAITPCLVAVFWAWDSIYHQAAYFRREVLYTHQAEYPKTGYGMSL